MLLWTSQENLGKIKKKRKLSCESSLVIQNTSKGFCVLLCCKVKRLGSYVLVLYCYCRCGHFAIYDGHGGRLAAEFAKKHLHLNVLSAGFPRELVCFTLFRY